MDSETLKHLPGVLAVTFIFGGGVLVWIVSTVAENWRKARVAEQNAVLKKAMIDRGFSAEEIVRVLAADADEAGKMADTPPAPARSA